MKPILIFLSFWTTTLCLAQKTDTVPVIISIPPEEYKIATLTDSIFGESARVIFIVGVFFKNPLRDFTKEIKVTEVKVSKLTVKLLETNKEYTISCESYSKKDAFQQKICEHFTQVFLYLFQHQPYEKMGDNRKSFDNAVYFGGSVNIVPPDSKNP